MLHNAKGADGKAMVGCTDPPVLLVPQEGSRALDCHLQGEEQRDEEKQAGQARQVTN